jgi:hypothetical protein
MSQVNIERVEVIERPRQGQGLSLRVTVSWPIDGEETSLTVNTWKESGEIENTIVASANDQVIMVSTDPLVEHGHYSVEGVGANQYRTRVFHAIPEDSHPPNAGFIPIT